MLRNICVAPKILRVYSSTLSVDYLATVAGNIAAPACSGSHLSSETEAESAASRPRASCLSVQSRLHNLERANPFPLMRESVLCNNPPESLQLSDKFRKYLREGRFTKALIKMLAQSYLDENHIANLFASGTLTKSEYSTFVNKLLLEKDLNSKLSNLVPDTVHTEILMSLFEIYCTFVLGHSQGKLTSLQVYDLNLFVKKFIDEGQLGKAQKCLQLIIDRQNMDYILETRDVSTIKHFLQLRCGALPKYWRMRRPDPKQTKRLGENRFTCNLSNSYRLLDEKALLKILNFFFEENPRRQKNTSALDSTIVYSLGYLGQIRLINKFIGNRWSTSKPEVINGIRPQPELLIAVLSAHCLKNGDMSEGLKALDQLMHKFPSIDLDKIFWRRLLQLSFQARDVKEDRKGKISHACWNIMKQWHARKGRNIPFDQGILSMMYDLFKTTKNGKGAMDVVSNCFQSFYLRHPQDMTSNELRLLEKYQKLSIKIMASKGNYHKPLQFIKEWSINDTNKHALNEFFRVHRQKYEIRQNKNKLKKQSIQTKFDDMEEEDMLLGRLW